MQREVRTYPLVNEQNELLAHYPPLIAQLLSNRGIDSLPKAEAFLKPEWSNHHDPFLMKNIREGIIRCKEAIDSNERTAIYADYDADGVPGSVVLSSLFDKIGYTNYEVYLPHRHDEGYGIHLEALETLKKRGVTLIITIDVGITGHEAAAWARKEGLDLIITDHHEPLMNEDGTQSLPDAFLLINPKQETCSYPDPMLCGCGVIFKFVQAFIAQYGTQYAIPEGWEKWLLDMVGLSTISDMVPLQNENRIFAYFGMKVIQKTKRKGLKKIMWDSGLDLRHLTEEDVAFSVTPKLNAASRMSHPEDAYAALTAKTDLEATAAVNHLNDLNNQRKKLVTSTMKQALTTLRGRTLHSVIVIGHTDWQAGILGLVASKLVEHYNLPAFVWSEEHGEIKGSCRSAQSIDLVRLMESSEENTFLQFGGHSEAGGFSCLKKEVHFLEERLSSAHERYMKSHGTLETEPLFIEAELSVDDITVETYKNLRLLAPFGQGNPKPIFLFKEVLVASVEAFGKEKNHLKVMFKNSRGASISAIKYFSSPEEMTSTPKEGTTCSMIASLEYSVFRGSHELRLHLVDIY